jgi:hypothetical protein
MTTNDLFIHLINKQFEIAGHDTSIYNYEWAKSTSEWYSKLTISEAKEKEFKDYFYKTLKRKVKLIDREYGMFILAYGLKSE